MSTLVAQPILSNNDALKLLADYVDYQDGVLYWKKKPSRPVKVGDKVGCTVDDYLRFSFKKKTMANHRVIYFLHYGVMPEFVDHINGNTFDNRVENLRPATRSQNMANSKPHKARQAKGSYKLPSGKFMSIIQKDKVRKYLGVYDSEQEAENAYALMAKTMHGEYARCAA